jgi:hypothetical protein
MSHRARGPCLPVVWVEIGLCLRAKAGGFWGWLFWLRSSPFIGKVFGLRLRQHHQHAVRPRRRQGRVLKCPCASSAAF